MDFILWAKALLVCFRRFKRVIGEIDITMDTVALCSGTGTRDTFEVLERAADLIARKVRILNLRVITGQMLASLPQDKRRILYDRFIEGESAAAVAGKEGLTLRAVYRALNGSVSVCADYLKNAGFDGAYFEKRYGSEGWIMCNLRKLENEECNGGGNQAQTTPLFHSSSK